MGWFSRVPKFGSKLTHSAWFEKMVRKSFDEVDVDRDGALDTKELYIALLKLYDMLNNKLPCHITVPTLNEINQMMVDYDTDKNGKLHLEEYLSLTRALIGHRKSWRQSLLFKITLALIFKTAVFPLGGKLLRGGVLNLAGMAGLRNPVLEKCVPLGVAMLGVEAALKPVYSM